MIERVARALEPRAFKCLDRGWVYGPGHIPEHNVTGLQNAAKRADRARVKASAAIAAMREPTEAMVKEGRLVAPMYDDPTPPPEDYWSAMIDAALAESAS